MKSQIISRWKKKKEIEKAVKEFFLKNFNSEKIEKAKEEYREVCRKSLRKSFAQKLLDKMIEKI